MATKLNRHFADFKATAHNWITLTMGEYYPDILPDACQLYTPVLVMFGQLLKTSESSMRLFMQISEVRNSWMRVQLYRVFRKYVSPEIPVEMMKRKSKALEICQKFGDRFRHIQEVQSAFMSRPIPDETMVALLWEYKSRGQKGYDLTERFFDLFRNNYANLLIEGPVRAGKDILMSQIFPDYPQPKRPIDFVIYDINKSQVLAIGLARYDSDRGGGQEDDRTGGYQNCANEILQYTQQNNLRTKIIFLNDGPGLLLGSMWDDYAKLESSWPDKIMVVTLRMVTERISIDWLYS